MGVFISFFRFFLLLIEYCKCLIKNSFNKYKEMLDTNTTRGGCNLQLNCNIYLLHYNMNL